MKQPEALRLADELPMPIFAPEAAELRRLHQFELAFTKYLEKTEWVQKTAKPHELGMDRADVLKQRIDRLHEVNQMLLDALKGCLEKGKRWHSCDLVVIAAHAAIEKAGQA